MTESPCHFLFPDDVKETYNSISDLNKTFILIRDALQAIEASSPNIDLAIRVSECLSTCEEAILRLEKKLDKLYKDNPKGFRQNAQASGLRLIYPFKKSTLEKLKEIVQELKLNLSLAISGLQLGTMSETLSTAETKGQLEATTEGVKALLSKEDAQALHTILLWLSPPDPSINHIEARRLRDCGFMARPAAAKPSYALRSSRMLSTGSLGYRTLYAFTSTSHAAGKHGTALQAAVFYGNVEFITMLLNARADVNVTSGVYGSALQAAVYCQNESIVALLLKAEAHVNIVSGVYGSALQAAVYCQSESMVASLLKAGAEVDNVADSEAVAAFCGTALQAAAYLGNITIVEMLLDSLADVNVVGGKYDTAVAAAAWCSGELITPNYERIVDLLIRAGANPNIQVGSHFTALMAAVDVQSVSITEMLIKAGAELNTIAVNHNSRWNKDKDEKTALFLAISSRNDPLVKILVAAGVDVNVEVKRKKQDGVMCRDRNITPLELSVERGHHEIVELLFRKGANLAGIRGLAALDAATKDWKYKKYKKGIEMVVELLVSSGIDASGAILSLFRAVAAGSEKVVTLMLVANVDINSQGSVDNWHFSLNTPLMQAVASRHEHLIHPLLAEGADVNG
ncbi:Ankyrin repeat domain-containing protein [Lachnellula occidentalis]|uniref:Ankyrin repeat domain-containing protein n=1 Tax=Lachnellula occidentalis TaxID=215460 RepID=A0A8H8U630_9HELO|nr:Ankyrin repeat domain-containing protein [Lachnellula occidentalis]